MDWYLWRPLTSPKLPGVTWTDLHTTMSFEDLVRANELIDALEAAESLARRQ